MFDTTNLPKSITTNELILTALDPENHQDTLQLLVEWLPSNVPVGSAASFCKVMDISVDAMATIMVEIDAYLARQKLEKAILANKQKMIATIKLNIIANGLVNDFTSK